MKDKVVVARINPDVIGVPQPYRACSTTLDPFCCNCVLLCPDKNDLISETPVVAQYEWPELIGVEIMKAKVVVERVNPAITGVPLKDKGYFASPDPSCCNRVLLCPDGNGLIRVKPVVG
ncbi:hypothetical protein BC332_00384 [Capsicum chinense]|nr:hypothetical protein BC332_00384 [Capsicum chinense]